MTYRSCRRSGTVPAPAVAAVAVLALAAYGTSAAKHPAGHAGAPAEIAAAMAPPPGGSVTLASFPQAILSGLGDRAAPCAVAGIRGWMRAEGSNPDWRNPLDSERTGPGSYRVNETAPGQGVQAYPSLAEGRDRTLITLRNGRYGPILSALHAGNSAQAIADAVAASPWGTEKFEASC